MACRALAFAVLLSALPPPPAHAQSAQAVPDDVEVARAIQKVKTDPNLATERTIQMLQWKDSKTPPSKRPAWLDWVTGFFRWIDQTSRLLVWVVVAALAALLAGYVVRTMRAWESSATGEGAAFVAPTHVQDLDIRPESLPPNIGAVARQLWDRGEHRAALALLYRGLLSRLAHVHQLPIRDSSTEGDCLRLASRMNDQGRGYASELIRLWQSAVYGRLHVETGDVYALCDGFSAALDLPAAEGEA